MAPAKSFTPKQGQYLAFIYASGALASSTLIPRSTRQNLCVEVLGELLVILGEGRKPDLPGDEVREPAFGMKAVWISEAFVNELTREGFTPIDNISVLLTHLSEVIRNNLAQLLSYKDMRILFDRLGPEYKRLIDVSLADFVFWITSGFKACTRGASFYPELAFDT